MNSLNDKQIAQNKEMFMIVEKSHIELEKKFDRLSLKLDETTETANKSKSQCIQFLSWS